MDGRLVKNWRYNSTQLHLGQECHLFFFSRMWTEPNMRPVEFWLPVGVIGVENERRARTWRFW